MSDDMKRDIQKLKSDMSDLRTTNKQIITALVKLDEKLESGFERMATKADFSVLLARMDGFIAKSEEGRRT